MFVKIELAYGPKGHNCFGPEGMEGNISVLEKIIYGYKDLSARESVMLCDTLSILKGIQSEIAKGRVTY